MHPRQLELVHLPAIPRPGTVSSSLAPPSSYFISFFSRLVSHLRLTKRSNSISHSLFARPFALPRSNECSPLQSRLETKSMGDWGNSVCDCTERRREKKRNRIGEKKKKGQKETERGEDSQAHHHMSACVGFWRYRGMCCILWLRKGNTAELFSFFYLSPTLLIMK